MNNAPESRRPNISVAEGFVIPEFSGQDAETIEDTFDLTHYTSAPLIPGSQRRVVFGTENPRGIQRLYATRGFAIHTLEPAEKGTLADLLIAPPEDMTTEEFLRQCLGSLDLALPTREDFPVPLKRIAAGMARTGLKSVAGLSMSVHANDPSTRFPSLFVPRSFLNGEFQSQNDHEPPHEFGIKLAAATFALLSLRQLKAMQSENNSERE